MSEYILDASVACQWLWNEEFTEQALGLVGPENRFFAPDLFTIEVHSAILKRVRRDGMGVQDADDCRRQLKKFPVQYQKTAPLADLAYELTSRTGVSFYDGLYLALAVFRDAKLVTADRRFYNGLKSGPLGKYVVWIEKATKRQVVGSR